MSPPSPEVRVATRTITGRRDHNEDGVLTTEMPDDRRLLAVADGMGGHAAGEVASALALETLEARLRDGDDLEDAVLRANDEVFAAAHAEAGKKGMGTTLVVLLMDEEGYRIANVGDSRAYLVDSDGIRQISRDHSFVAEAVRRGESEAEAKASRWKDALTRSIGTAEEVEVDVFGPFEPEAGTAVLLCSDGLFKALEDLELRSLYSTSEDVEDAADILVDAAHRAGSDDNITVAIVEFGEVHRVKPGETAPLFWPREPGTEERPGAAGATERPAERAEGETALPDEVAPVEGAATGRWGSTRVAIVLVVALALVAAILLLL